MIWLALGTLIVIALLVVMPPLLRRKVDASDVAASELAVYRDQLREIDGDLERGLISPLEAEAARLEIKRRLLAAAPKGERVANTGSGPRKIIAVAVGVGLSVFSGALYLSLGRPTLPGRAFDQSAVQSSRDEAAQAMLREVETMVAKLAERLKASPNDAMGWRMLGWSYVQLGRVSEGVAAFKRAVDLEPKNAALRSQYGEAVVRAADGKVTADALKIFDEVLVIDAKEPRARFYRGVALMQAGKESEALALWVQIMRDGPADAEWMAGLREQAGALAQKLKLDPKAASPEATR